MEKSDEMISLDQAKQEVSLVSRRLGLLHLSFSEILIEEFGEKKGKELIVKAIEDYSRKIGREKRNVVERLGLEATIDNIGKARDIPHIGIHEGAEQVEEKGEKRVRAYGCVMAKVWREYGKDDLGRLYCYVDPANVMEYNPNFKLIHTKAVPDGDEFCELALRETTEEEREAYKSRTVDWSEVDK